MERSGMGRIASLGAPFPGSCRRLAVRADGPHQRDNHRREDPCRWVGHREPAVVAGQGDEPQMIEKGPPEPLPGRATDAPERLAPVARVVASLEGQEKTGGRMPWSVREIWVAATLPGGILIFLSLLIFVVGGLFDLSRAEVDASWILFGPSLVLVAWSLLIHGRGVSRKDLGLRGFKPGGSLLVPMLLVVDFIFVLSYTGLLDLLGLLPAAKATGILPLGLINTAVVAPVCEELFFRGVLFTGFRHYYGPRKAAVFSAVIFSLSHLDPLFFVPHTITGIVLAALLDATGSIWPSILLHAAWNTWIIMGEAGFWIVVLIAFLTMAVVAVSPLWFALHRFWQRAGGAEPPSSP